MAEIVILGLYVFVYFPLFDIVVSECGSYENMGPE